jgi:hypothetical protein
MPHRIDRREHCYHYPGAVQPVRRASLRAYRRHLSARPVRRRIATKTLVHISALECATRIDGNAEQARVINWRPTPVR